MAVAVDLDEGFGRKRRIVNLLAELKRNDRILIAVDNQNGRANLLQPYVSIELAVRQQADARQKPENLARNLRSRRKWGLKNHASDLLMCCQMGGDRSPQRLAVRDNRFHVDAFRLHEIFVSGVGILLDSSFARLSFAVAVTPVLQSQDVCRCASKKLIDRCAVSNV